MVPKVSLALVLAVLATAAQAGDAGNAEPQAGLIASVRGSRNWGDTFLPKSNPPARRLLVLHEGKLKHDERVAATCLQALVAREQPVLWLSRSKEMDWWLDWHKERGHIDGYADAPELPQLFAQYARVCKGAVVPDARLYCGELLALNVAACEDLVVASDDLAKRLGLPVRHDLRGKFTTYAEGLRWLWQTYKDRLNPHLCDFRAPKLITHGTFDYPFQWRGLMFWVTGKKEQALPGADSAAERQVMTEILAQMPVLGVCTGFPALAEGEGMGEPPGVELLSRYGKSLVCTNHVSNYSLLSGVCVAKLERRHQTPPPPDLQRDKIYIALVLSDGDNQILWPAFFKQYFDHPSLGTFPLAFGMGPAMGELQPGIAQWYFEHATPVTEFIADVSGAGYMQPDHFAEAYSDRGEVWAGYLAWTKRIMEPLELRSIRTVGGSDENVARYAKALPFCHSIFADMGRYSGRSGIEKLTYSIAGGMPVFRAATSWRYGKDGFLREVREQVGAKRPAFVNGFVHCWTFKPEDVAGIYERRNPDMIFVTPSQLADLYRQAAATR
ncbi:MAG: GxGYxYP family putative glycoside hydrolase [Planctomycetota bacterium]|nr:GxGYxYP family putative glycoside hydrolase [Planctomycetota bacterium]